MLPHRRPAPAPLPPPAGLCLPLAAGLCLPLPAAWLCLPLAGGRPLGAGDGVGRAGVGVGCRLLELPPCETDRNAANCAASAAADPRLAVQRIILSLTSICASSAAFSAAISAAFSAAFSATFSATFPAAFSAAFPARSASPPFSRGRFAALPPSTPPAFLPPSPPPARGPCAAPLPPPPLLAAVGLSSGGKAGLGGRPGSLSRPESRWIHSSHLAFHPS
mmetsp:Transcript_12897/g.43330  ORF Transcript_12897/g.43330 Transcript_12897/m.43330 type:complete len:220 (-) Transcript_12897:570-1229(-)